MELSARIPRELWGDRPVPKVGQEIQFSQPVSRSMLIAEVVEIHDFEATISGRESLLGWEIRWIG